MAPEVILQLPYTKKADVFSYGLVLLEVITRKKIGTEIPRDKNFGLDLPEIQSLHLIPEICPKNFSDLAFLCCSYRDDDRPNFDQILKFLEKIQRGDLGDIFTEEKSIKEVKEEDRGGGMVRGSGGNKGFTIPARESPKRIPGSTIPARESPRRIPGSEKVFPTKNTQKRKNK